METAIGYVPNPADINLEGLDMTEADIAELLTVDKELWLQDAQGIEEFYAKFGEQLPKELRDELDRLKSNLNK